MTFGAFSLPVIQDIGNSTHHKQVFDQLALDARRSSPRSHPCN